MECSRERETDRIISSEPNYKYQLSIVDTMAKDWNSIFISIPALNVFCKLKSHFACGG